MLKLGEKQILTIVETKDFGVYLAEPSNKEEKVLLPAKQVPHNAKIGSELEVFLYRDSQDRIIATVNEPLITLGRVAYLTVRDCGKIGAFLDWGLEKDLLLPFKEQTASVNVGDSVLVALYIDKSSRLCATMKVYKYLDRAQNYAKDDKVSGIVYEISKNFGAFVAVDYKYSALIPIREMPRDIRVGDIINARVTAVKEDGKLDLSVKEKVEIQISIDAAKIVKYLDSNNGIIPFTDKADPQIIRDNFDMSKNEFKRAIGNLLKMGKVEISESQIRSRN